MPSADEAAGGAQVEATGGWGPGAEPGIAEMTGVLRAGGTAFVIDNDLRTGTFADWLAVASRT